MNADELYKALTWGELTPARLARAKVVADSPEVYQQVLDRIEAEREAAQPQEQP